MTRRDDVPTEPNAPSAPVAVLRLRPGAVLPRYMTELAAGCDLVLVCAPSLVAESLDAMAGKAPCPEALIAALTGCVATPWQSLIANPQRDVFIARLAQATA